MGEFDPRDYEPDLSVLEGGGDRRILGPSEDAKRRMEAVRAAIYELGEGSHKRGAIRALCRDMSSADFDWAVRRLITCAHLEIIDGGVRLTEAGEIAAEEDGA